MNGTIRLIILNIIFGILNIVPRTSLYVRLNINTFIYLYYFHTLLTSIFIPEGFISFIFTVLILWWSGKMIENMYGTKFLYRLYVTCGIITGLLGLLIQYVLKY